MKTQSRFGVTIPTNCNCNCWASIKQTDTNEVTLYTNGCEGTYSYFDWYRLDEFNNFPAIFGQENQNQYLTAAEGELIAVLFTGANGCCSVMSNLLRIQ